MDSSLALADCSSVLLRRRKVPEGREKIELVGLGKLGRGKISFSGNIHVSPAILFTGVCYT